MNLNITFSNAAPEQPGIYLIYFPESSRYDVVSVFWQTCVLNKSEQYLMAAGRGGCIYNWQCLWSEPLPQPTAITPNKSVDYSGIY